MKDVGTFIFLWSSSWKCLFFGRICDVTVFLKNLADKIFFKLLENHSLDLHKNLSQIHLCDEQMIENSIGLKNDEPVMRGFFETLMGNCKVAAEATGNWYWLESHGLSLLKNMSQLILFYVFHL